MTRRPGTRHRHVEQGEGAVVVTYSELGAPDVGEHREAKVSPLPAVSMEDAFAEMYANDPEAQEWIRSERLADLFGRAR